MRRQSLRAAIICGPASDASTEKFDGYHCTRPPSAYGSYEHRLSERAPEHIESGRLCSPKCWHDSTFETEHIFYDLVDVIYEPPRTDQLEVIR